MAAPGDAAVLDVEETDAWLEYLTATSGSVGDDYATMEPWAWAKLQERLAVVKKGRKRKKRA